MDAVTKAFESKEDPDPPEEEACYELNPISSRIKLDKDKSNLFNASLAEISKRFAHILSHVLITAEQLINISSKQDVALTLLGDVLQFGADTFINETSKGDKFRIPEEVVDYLNQILKNTINILKHHARNREDQVDETTMNNFKAPQTSSFQDLNPISDKTGLVGAWDNFLFANLGTSERVIKLFASLSRVPLEAKSRWINMYIAQVKLELELTLYDFVTMQSMPHIDNSSETFLLDANRSIEITPSKSLTPRSGYLTDKNRVPARCYLAGRRWRLTISKALKDFKNKDEVINSIVDKISEFKAKTAKQTGTDLDRLCLPRLEVGLKGWDINGDPNRDSVSQSNEFPLKNPVEGLNKDDDPFTSGVKIGYRIGFKIGYNDKRNASLEMENAYSGTEDFKKKAEDEARYLARASNRHGATIGAQKAVEVAVREGYMTTLKVRLRAGMLLLSEPASRLAALKGTILGGQAGQEAGRLVVERYLVDKHIKKDMKSMLTKLGESHGLLAGEAMGGTIGAIVGKEAAMEAFIRSVIQGGKVVRTKCQLEEFEAGVKDGFEHGLKAGERAASSSLLDPSVPRFFKFVQPSFTGKGKEEQAVDYWEKDLITRLTDEILDQLHIMRNHTIVYGAMKGAYKVAKEIKKNFKRVSYSNVTYNLKVSAKGFIRNDIAILTLKGHVNNFNVLRGSLIARNIINAD